MPEFKRIAAQVSGAVIAGIGSENLQLKLSEKSDLQKLVTIASITDISAALIGLIGAAKTTGVSSGFLEGVAIGALAHFGTIVARLRYKDLWKQLLPGQPKQESGQPSQGGQGPPPIIGPVIEA